MNRFFKRLVRLKKVRTLLVMALVLMAAVLIAPATTFAAGAVPVAGNPFFNIYTIVTGWLNGALALTLSLAAVIIGLVIGLIRTSPMPALAGLAFAMVATVIPGIVISIMGAIV